ncbi:MAG: glycosyltransferase family 4 protein [Anaerolineales bacterium]|nr:glycosyltransferase family 4 protein [Anaerolineales bacterium]
MRLGIDASRATAARRTGTERYARRLIEGLAALAPPHTLRLYFRDQPGDWLAHNPAVERRIIPFPRLWTHVRLSWALLAERPRPDALFVPAHVLPMLHPLPSVVTVHDLGYHYFPEAHPPRQRSYLEWSTRRAARAATHLLADSQATARDLTAVYGVPPEKVTVVYPGRDEALRRVDPAAVRARYDLPADFLLHVGTLQPRKNLLRLIEAVEQVRTQHPALTLVLAGRAGWLAEPIMAAARARPWVRRLDYVPDADLAGLYSAARVFAFPSLYEGFGFPVLEALACGVPVVCANTSSLPELAGEAALLVDPLDVGALAKAIGRVLSEPALAETLLSHAPEQLARFTWARAAEEAMRVLLKVVGGEKP